MLVIAALWSALAMVAAPSANGGFVPTLHVGDAVPSVRLVDQFDKPLKLYDRGGATVVSFTYARCPDARMCPLVTAKFAQLQRRFDGTNLHLVELTLDPVHDRPETLRRYAEMAGARAGWKFATGRPVDVWTAAERFGIVRSRTAGGGFEHTQAVAIVSRAGVLTALIEGDGWSVDSVAAAARDSDPAPPALGSLRTAAFDLFARAGAACGAAAAYGLPQVAPFVIFAGLALGFGWLVARLFAITLPDRS